MKRRSFFQLVFGGIAGVLVGAKATSSQIDPVLVVRRLLKGAGISTKTKKWVANINEFDPISPYKLGKSRDIIDKGLAELNLFK